jgi:hypothetical protein
LWVNGSGQILNGYTGTGGGVAGPQLGLSRLRAVNRKGASWAGGMGFGPKPCRDKKIF